MDNLPGLGEPAPGFELPNQHGEPVSLAGCRGTAVVLVFFPFAFSRVCTGELDDLQQQVSEFEDQGIRLLGVSVDSKYTLRSFAEEQGYAFDLLADFWPHGAVAEQYGVLDHDRGYARRATFFIDQAGLIRSRLDAPLGETRPLAGYYDALRTLSATTEKARR